MGGKCELDTDSNYGDGTAYGEMEFSVPSNTFKWRLEIEFDSQSNVTSINADFASNERCDPDQNKCFFENEDYGFIIEAGERFEFSSFEIEFDDIVMVPEIKQVIFQSCPEACDAWTTNAIVCGEGQKSKDEIS